MDEYEFDVFLSYNRADEPWVRSLYHRLQSCQSPGGPMRIFFAPESLPPGALIVRDLSVALKASRRVVVVLTPEWIASDWTNFEASIELYRDPAAKQMRLVPIVLRTCEAPDELARLRNIDFRSESDFERSFAELAAAIEAGRHAASAESAAKQDRERVLNAAVLPWSPQGSPSFRFLWPERFIDPTVRPHKSLGPPVRFAAWDSAHRNIGAVVLVGAPGGGKTTLLRSLFLRDDSIYSPQYKVHFITAGTVVADSKRVGSNGSQSDDMAGGHLVLIDGVDEVGASGLETVMSYAAEVRERGAKIRIACRTDFFFRHIAMRDDWSGLFGEVVELLEWTRSDAEVFTQRYANQAGDPTLLQRAIELLDRIPSPSPLWRNPLQLTLLLYLLHSRVHISQQEVTYPYALYGVVYRHWQHRERHRGTGQVSALAVESAHVAVAKALDATRGDSPPRLRDAIAAAMGDSLDAVLEDTAFRGLIDTRLDDDGVEVVIAFRHETFAEFVISRSVISAFEQGGYAIDKALAVTYGSHINRFVRSGLEFRAAVRASHILENLVTRYEALLVERLAEGSGQMSYAENDAMREQLVYYIGRLPSVASRKFLRRAYAAETAPIIRRSAALGAISQGDQEIERDYLTRLRIDPAEDLLNRSVQIIYFNDDKGDFHNYRDLGSVSWRRTRDHIFERLVTSGVREMGLRWWDMETLLSFFRSRPNDALSATEIEVLKGMLCGDRSTDRACAIAATRDLLLTEASPGY
ncbi:TIR domain-containing protein [Plantactinospora sp. S1510]|uniref:TIR domain-containing protein n=1 Tax=Plantactinospora alkalitolerans TaxID=2789879 RepID=A0ABS0GNI2_9ACTN|nr:toll/interleukin-1 receptor domain-containing protein [Plantactinospora alkalitolerans]MBF9127619.1 TIR domain-containing protein [Plantactinospora alkalitolerans]